MKKNEKKMILVLILVSIIIIGIIFCVTQLGKQGINNNSNNNNNNNPASVETKENGEIEEYRVKIEPETTLEESQDVGGLEVGNVQMQYMGEETVIIADIKNTTSETIESSPAVFRLLNDDGDVMGEIDLELGTIDAGRTLQLSMGITRDVRSATNFEIEIK